MVGYFIRKLSGLFKNVNAVKDLQGQGAGALLDYRTHDSLNALVILDWILSWKKKRSFLGQLEKI